MCMLHMHEVGHSCSGVAMWNFMVLLIGCGLHEYMSVMHLLCVSLSIVCSAHIFMVMVMHA